MTLNNLLPTLILLSALIPGLLIFAVPEHRPWLRRALNLSASVLCLSLIGLLISGVYAGDVFETRLPLLPTIDLVLHADALSLLFVSLSGLLWLFTTIYAIGYLEGTENRSRFFGFFSLCVGATLGIALAGNLITFLIFYELLTLTTYPLVVHKGNAASLRAGRIYLAYTLIGGALLLAGVVWLKALAGPLDFTATGVLSAMPHLDPGQLKIIFALLIAGLGVKAALFPFHGWLPIAMAAPAPVSALLHAVAVVKAGAFGIIRVTYDVYGIEFARDLGLTAFLAGIAAFTIVYGSILALRQDDLKKRLAYSTVSQVSYIALGVAIAGPIATIGGMVHLVHQGVMKITLFFCAGNLAERLGVYKVSQMNGIGKRMPLTMAAFTVAALGMIGLPPIAGFVSKWFLGTGAIEVGAYWVLGILAVSSLLNALYFLPILHAAWLKSPETTEGSLHKNAEGSLPKTAEGSWMLWLPPVVTATLAVAVGLFANASVSPLSWVELIAAREYGRELVIAIESLHFSHSLLEWIVLTPLLIILGLLIPRMQSLYVRIAPLAALPALWVALAFSPELSIESNSLPGLFFGGILSIDHDSRVMLMLSAVLWLIAGLYGKDYLSGDKQLARYTLCFLLCMAGSFGLILSQDLFGFITFFTLMSFAAYGFVVHSGNSEALRAGKTYIQWVVIGEVLLFAALVGLAITGGSTHLIDMERSAQPLWVSWLLLIGFGIKAGLLGMHFWLPRAHPVAPVPASALLSGLMVKAGLLGWWRFLPLGEVALIDMGQVLIILGFGGAFIAVIAGVVQNNPKTLLAYSTISQMGIVAAGVGAGLLAPSLWPLLSAALLLYAVHHGLAKSALFLSVGLTNLLSPASGRRWFVWLLIAIPALAMVGLPLTSGALAKFALKHSVAGMDWLTLLLPITAIGTTLLMLRFIVLLRQASLEVEPATTIKNKRFFSYAVLVLLLIGLVYWMPQAKIFIPEVLAFSSIWNALWPVIAGSFIFLATHSLFSRITPIPAGDLIVLIERAINSLGSFIQVKSQSAKAIIVQNRLLLSGVETVSNGKQTAGLFMSKQVTNKLVAIKVDPGIVFISTVICLSLAFALSSTL